MHRSGDKPVDNVDNTVNKRSPEVINRPNGPISVTNSGDSASTERSGRDLAHAALAAAKEKAAARRGHLGVRKSSSTHSSHGQSSHRQSSQRRRWSGAGADQRDPQPLGRLTQGLANRRGWSTKLATGQVFARWEVLVGPDLAEHAQPISLHEGELTVRASSTAWATQLRLLQGQLLAKIAAGVGHGVVKRMRIQGPASPNWRKGPLYVAGRGPRDTYG